MGGGQSNISVVYICDQRFSKHTLIEICLLEEKLTPKQEFLTILHPILHQKQDFEGAHLVG